MQWLRRIANPIVGWFQRKKRGRLDGCVVYLSGPMEYVADAGVGWRKEFRRLIEEAGVNIKIIDPTRKPGEPESMIAEAKSYQEMLQKSGRFEELRAFVHDYRRKDLRFVDISDVMVVVIDRNTYQCGTLNEVFLAEMQHKPILTICSGGLYELPRWLFDVLDLSLVFTSVEDVVEELISINQQPEELDARWVLVRKHL